MRLVSAQDAIHVRIENVSSRASATPASPLLLAAAGLLLIWASAGGWERLSSPLLGLPVAVLNAVVSNALCDWRSAIRLSI